MKVGERDEGRAQEEGAALDEAAALNKVVANVMLCPEFLPTLLGGFDCAILHTLV